MTRAYNFCAGPAALPLAVLERARDELTDYQGRGLSVMEMSHRSTEFVAIAEAAEQSLRRLLAIGDDHAVLFMQGGASTQFAAVPLNIGNGTGRAGYVDTGYWAGKAIKEARRFVDVDVLASSKDDAYTRVPEIAALPTGLDYVHITPNETIGGVEYHAFPDTGDVPLVGDASSTLLSRPLDVTRFGILYAGAQKNIGPAGLTVVIVRRDLIGQARETTPDMLNYATLAAADSMANTPPTYTWYLAGLVFDWLLEQGGLAAMEARNRAKAECLYTAIDASSFYASPVAPAARSWMNVPFTLADPGLDGAFLDGAEARGLLNLKGHRSVGGMRASLYNAVPQAAVDALIDYMGEFEREHG